VLPWRRRHDRAAWIPRATRCPRHKVFLRFHIRRGRNERTLEVDEEALIVWQDVLDMVVNGRPNEVACPHCNHRPLTIEEVDQSTRISCSKCGKFIQGRFG
jgi:ribosomal protein S27E